MVAIIYDRLYGPLAIFIKALKKNARNLKSYQSRAVFVVDREITKLEC